MQECVTGSFRFVKSKISEVNVFSEIKIFFENYSRLKWLPKGQSWSLKELFSLHKTLEPKRIDSSAYFAGRAQFP